MSNDQRICMENQMISFFMMGTLVEKDMREKCPYSELFWHFLRSVIQENFSKGNYVKPVPWTQGVN